MIRWLLKLFGYYKVEYGFACGRHWLSIDDVMIAQTDGDTVYLPDSDVERIVYYTLDKGEHWNKPESWRDK